MMRRREITDKPLVEVKITGDGSHTLFVPSLNEHYHSVFGAIQESRHIFINTGLKALPDDSGEISILEIGFGTGLNALLTCLEIQHSALRILYSAVERWPLAPGMSSLLNYPGLLSDPAASEIFHQLHACIWDKRVNITDQFHLQKILLDLKDYQPEMNAFDLVYFDAFGPDVQPDLWSPEIFQKMHACMKSGGILVTYSTKGEVKRNLKRAGFAIEKLPGPPGKREILRAVKMH